jgi:RNase P protein component
MFRLHREKLPDGISIVVASRGDIGALTRRNMREQLSELLDRARALLPPQRLRGISRQ